MKTWVVWPPPLDNPAIARLFAATASFSLFLPRFHWCNFAFTLFELPKLVRCAICLSVKVVSLLNRAPIASYSGPFLRRSGNSCFVDPKRSNSPIPLLGSLADLEVATEWLERFRMAMI